MTEQREDREDWEGRKETFGNFLTRRYHELSIKQPGRFKSMAQFAAWLGVKQTTFSTWTNDQKTPKGANIDLLAEKLGPEVYQVLGVKPRTINKKVQLIDLVWNHIPARERDSWYNRAMEIHEGGADSEPRDKRSRTTG